jgi:hypothetical protein
LSFGERNEGFHKSGIPNSWMVSIKNGWFGGNPTLGSLQMITWTHIYICWKIEQKREHNIHQMERDDNKWREIQSSKEPGFFCC